jgi:hypothetical protein
VDEERSRIVKLQYAIMKNFVANKRHTTKYRGVAFQIMILPILCSNYVITRRGNRGTKEEAGYADAGGDESV